MNEKRFRKYQEEMIKELTKTFNEHTKRFKNKLPSNLYGDLCINSLFKFATLHAAKTYVNIIRDMNDVENELSQGCLIEMGSEAIGHFSGLLFSALNLYNKNDKPIPFDVDDENEDDNE